MNRIRIIEQIKAAVGNILGLSIIEYKETYELDDLPGNGLITKDLAYDIANSGVSYFPVSKGGSDVDGSGNIDVSSDSVPTGKKLLSVEIDGEPDFTQHFYSEPQGLVYGFSTDIAPDAEISIVFI